MTTAMVTATKIMTTAAVVIGGGRNKDNGSDGDGGGPDNNQPKASAGHGGSGRNRGSNVGCPWSQVVSTFLLSIYKSFIQY